MDAHEYRLIRAYSEICRTYKRHIMANNFPYQYPFYQLESQYRSATAIIQTLRKKLLPTTEQSIREREEFEIKKTLNDIIQWERERTSIGIHVSSKPVSATSPKRAVLSVSVWYSWRIKVFRRFYKDFWESRANPFPNEIILHADRVSLNDREINLYRAIMYDLRTNTQYDGFIAASKTMPKLMGLAKTASKAKQATMEKIAAEILKQPQGE